jgi:hypothetical protein
MPEVDLSPHAHHRPCLVFDLWFRHAGRLHTLQIARSHDVYGGLPQNALGIARGWGRTLASMTGLPLGDLWFCSISNNFRVGDDAENVRRAIQSGVHAPAHAPTLPPPRVVTVDEGAAPATLAAAPLREAPILVAIVPRVSEREVGAPSEILAATPVLAERLLRYRGTINQIDMLITRLRAEVARDGREHSNSLLLSPRDPVSDRTAEATPLICLQLRRQLGHLHAAAILIGPDAAPTIPTLLNLHRSIATAVSVPVGSATFVHVARSE